MAEKRKQSSLFTFFNSSKSRRLDENTSEPENSDCEHLIEIKFVEDDKKFIHAEQSDSVGQSLPSREQLPTPTIDSVQVVNLEDRIAGYYLDSLDSRPSV